MGSSTETNEGKCCEPGSEFAVLSCLMYGKSTCSSLNMWAISSSAASVNKIGNVYQFGPFVAVHPGNFIGVFQEQRNGGSYILVVRVDDVFS
jgi:hypothetical protein